MFTAVKFPLKIFLALLCLAGLNLAGSAQTASQERERAGENWVLEAERLGLEYRKKIEALAVSCEKDGQEKEAAVIRRQIIPEAADKIFIPIFPSEIMTPPDIENAWETEFLEIRRTYAEELYTVAKSIAKDGRGTLAVRMAIDALHADPDNVGLRKIFGYKKVGDSWRTDWEDRKIKGGQIDHEDFGWISKNHLPRYEAGKRPLRSSWVDISDDRKAREKIKDGWEITSEHYTVKTNHSIDEGVRISRQLEDFHRAWTLIFFRYFHTERELCNIVGGKGKFRSVTQHKIVVYRDAADFRTNLLASLPPEDIAFGFYNSGSETGSFFLVDPETGDPDDLVNAERTIFHESAHQLFARYCRDYKDPNVNFWLTEAIALYLESFHIDDGYYVFGDKNDVRLQAARYRFVRKNYYIPSEKLVKLSMEEFHTFPEIPGLYSECGGYGHFLMHAEKGRYRDPLIVFLQAVYSRQSTTETLSKMTGRTYPELDQAYEKFITEGFR